MRKLLPGHWAREVQRRPPVGGSQHQDHLSLPAATTVPASSSMQTHPTSCLQDPKPLLHCRGSRLFRFHSDNCRHWSRQESDVTPNYHSSCLASAPGSCLLAAGLTFRLGSPCSLRLPRADLPRAAALEITSRSHTPPDILAALTPKAGV